MMEYPYAAGPKLSIEPSIRDMRAHVTSFGLATFFKWKSSIE
jgi:hypothetical protein